MNWIINIIGILIYFNSRYIKRKNKSKFNLKFWLKDNLPEFINTALFDLGCMLIITRPETQINISNFIVKYVPWLVVGDTIMKLIISFGLGLGLAALFYSIFKAKTKK